ncbi:uncharacterized protein MONOS_6576 [Monocercomonoides exilis]|uniref:uncharacterized protein n=1 Tax=Monocercomonoides exilis TaxID=2049356 RepID=UPI00355948A1|nr:hypothetical protein MONOS_6576 [Monocercomonoides exilis]|eukprot:MONOS_6576.1-p1 / transcript=MONOS_6576.1 / gene=MONOS_6576 / organism=Monocercomonoides_exilis_PA203 / gene_product=unspecified product / transcript_product=unspecified product / location=Mono_scaffold00209:58078-60552(-) / protein_length=736 / sequence_SO=supercontig / SO=protein_coding / is_pseudo=false
MCSAKLQGGCVFCEHVKTFSFVGCLVENSVAGECGGAVMVDDWTTLMISKCKFYSSNCSNAGGGLWIGEEHITKSHFSLIGSLPFDLSSSDPSTIVRDCLFEKQNIKLLQTDDQWMISQNLSSTSIKTKNLPIFPDKAGGAVFMSTSSPKPYSISGCFFSECNAHIHSGLFLLLPASLSSSPSSAISHVRSSNIGSTNSSFGEDALSRKIKFCCFSRGISIMRGKDAGIYLADNFPLASNPFICSFSTTEKDRLYVCTPKDVEEGTIQRMDNRYSTRDFSSTRKHNHELKNMKQKIQNEASFVGSQRTNYQISSNRYEKKRYFNDRENELVYQCSVNDDFLPLGSFIRTIDPVYGSDGSITCGQDESMPCLTIGYLLNAFYKFPVQWQLNLKSGEFTKEDNGITLGSMMLTLEGTLKKGGKLETTIKAIRVVNEETNSFAFESKNGARNKNEQRNEQKNYFVEMRGNNLYVNRIEFVWNVKSAFGMFEVVDDSQLSMLDCFITAQEMDEEKVSVGNRRNGVQNSNRTGKGRDFEKDYTLVKDLSQMREMNKVEKGFLQTNDERHNQAQQSRYAIHEDCSKVEVDRNDKNLFYVENSQIKLQSTTITSISGDLNALFNIKSNSYDVTRAYFFRVNFTSLTTIRENVSIMTFEPSSNSYATVDCILSELKMSMCEMNACGSMSGKLGGCMNVLAAPSSDFTLNNTKFHYCFLPLAKEKAIEGQVQSMLLISGETCFL